jgi:nucleotide-binding universal stress UspA family protein
MTTMMQTVLIPTAFTEDCRRVIDFASGLPGIGVKRAVLLNVVDASGMEGPVIAAKVDHVRSKLTARARDLEAAGLTVEVQVKTGDPVREISLAAQMMHVDAIVLGSHGKSVIDELLVGSISERILTDVSVPVLIVRFDLLRRFSEPEKLLADFGDRLLVPTDFSQAADRAFATALDLEAAGLVGEIVLLHVVDRSVGEDRIVDAEHEAADRMAELVKIAAARGVNATQIVTVGDATRVILDEIATRRCSGVVMGSRGLNPFAEAFVGSTSKTLIRQAPCPVLTVP